MSYARSDFDVYVVTIGDRLSPTAGAIRVSLEPEQIRTEHFYARGRGWDVTYWLQSQVDQIFQKVSWARFEDTSRVTAETLGSYDELFLSRLEKCIPLMGLD